MNSKIAPKICLSVLILVLSEGTHHVEARRYPRDRQDRIMFYPVSTEELDTTDESCAMEYANREENGLVEMMGQRFSQEFLELVGVGNNFTLCFGYMHGPNHEDMMAFRAMTFEVNAAFWASKVRRG